MKEVLESLGIEDIYHSIIKIVYDKLIATIMLNGEKLKAFPRRSGRKYGCPYLPNLFNIILEVSDRAMRQDKEIKKGMNSKVTLFVGVWFYTWQMPKSLSEKKSKLLELTNAFIKVPSYKFNIKVTNLPIYQDRLRKNSGKQSLSA